MSRSGRTALRGAPPAIALLLALTSNAPLARGAELLEMNPDSVLTVMIQSIEGSPLRLSEAQQLATRNATGVRDAEAALHAARGALRHESGAFDPELFLDALRTSVDQPTASPFAGGDSLPSGASLLRTRQTRASTGARVTLPLGTELKASLLATKTETNSSFSLLNPEFDSDGALSLRQPLLKGFGPGTWSDRSAAAREVEAAQARYDDVVLGASTDTERAYWDLYAAERDYGVQLMIRDRAKALLEETRLRGQAGLVGPNAVANAQVFLAEQEQVLLDREEALDRLSDQMATLMGQRPPAGAPRYKPTDEPPQQFTIEPEDSLVSRALRQSREVHGAERRWAAARARQGGAKWNLLPTLDLLGSVGGKGLSGNAVDFINPFTGLPDRLRIDGGFGDTWSQVRSRDFPTWSAGFSLSIPIPLRSGRGDYQRLRGEADRAEQSLIATRRSLEERVRAGDRELRHAAARMESARTGVTASLEQVRIGILQYRSGRTTAFELVRLAADLATAQQRFSQAVVRTAKAVADLKRLTSEGLPPVNPQ